MCAIWESRNVNIFLPLDFFGMLHHIFIKYIYFLCRNQSLGGSQASAFVVSYDKLDPKEIKDLLICFLYIVKNLSEGEFTIYNFEITIFLIFHSRKLPLLFRYVYISHDRHVSLKAELVP